jgi:hypothetical protein
MFGVRTEQYLVLLTMGLTPHSSVCSAVWPVTFSIKEGFFVFFLFVLCVTAALASLVEVTSGFSG